MLDTAPIESNKSPARILSRTDLQPLYVVFVGAISPVKRSYRTSESPLPLGWYISTPNSV